MKIKEQTRKLAAGCSKNCFEVVDKTDEVSYIYLRQGEADVVLSLALEIRIVRGRNSEIVALRTEMQ